MPNRSMPPTIAPLERVSFPKHREMVLAGVIPLVQLQSDNYDVVKVEFLFNAGRIFEEKKLVSKATNLLLKAGTLSMSSAEINESIDFYGATIGLPINFDHSGAVLYCLSKHANTLIPLLLDIILNPSFPEEELDQFRDQQKSKLKIALENVDTVAFRHITAAMYGDDHPYGYNSSAQDYDQLTRDDLLAHHHRLYVAENCKIFVSGNLLEKDLDTLKELTRQIPSGQKPMAIVPEIKTDTPESVRIPMRGKVQTAIRIGRKMFNRKHPDFQKLYILNVLLGGYFGSRLSMKIREEKGYSYGIHSSLESMAQDGYFMISTEVDKAYTKATLKAIYAELKSLRDHEVSLEELHQTRSYLQGFLLNSVDGVFRSSSLLRGLRETGVDEAYFETFQEVLTNITPLDIKQLAQRYLQQKDLWEVVVG